MALPAQISHTDIGEHAGSTLLRNSDRIPSKEDETEGILIAVGFVAGKAARRKTVGHSEGAIAGVCKIVRVAIAHHMHAAHAAVVLRDA
jgi:hypothetical protein